jgi:hypothetical protein
MIKQIYGLLTQRERKRGMWVALSVFIRAILDFAGVAALIPILLTVFGDKTDPKKALLPTPSVSSTNIKRNCRR